MHSHLICKEIVVLRSFKSITIECLDFSAFFFFFFLNSTVDFSVHDWNVLICFSVEGFFYICVYVCFFPAGLFLLYIYKELCIRQKPHKLTICPLDTIACPAPLLLLSNYVWLVSVCCVKKGECAECLLSV